MYLLGFLPALILFAVMGYLRYTKGIAPLRAMGRVSLPGFPGPRGLVNRLDGLDRRRREIQQGKSPLPKMDGSIILPDFWEGEMTAGRMASVAHTWGLCLLAENDTAGAKAREAAISRTMIIVFFTVLVAVALIFLKRVDARLALMLVSWIWAFLTFIAIPTHYREWKARDVAKKRLKEIGLWPRLAQDQQALDICLTAMIWCRVAGFRRILPE